MPVQQPSEDNRRKLVSIYKQLHQEAEEMTAGLKSLEQDLRKQLDAQEKEALKHVLQKIVDIK